MIERFATWSRSCLTMQGYGALSEGAKEPLARHPADE